MAKSVVDPLPRAAAAQAGAEAAAEPGGYFHWSRDAAVGLFAVLPLWLVYQALRAALAPEDRNGA